MKNISNIIQNKPFYILIESLINLFNINIAIILNKINGDIIGIYQVSNITIPNEVNGNILKLKGIEISSLIEKYISEFSSYEQYYLRDIKDKKEIQINFSINMFAYITIGIKGI